MDLYILPNIYELCVGCSAKFENELKDAKIDKDNLREEHPNEKFSASNGWRVSYETLVIGERANGQEDSNTERVE